VKSYLVLSLEIIILEKNQQKFYHAIDLALKWGQVLWRFFCCLDKDTMTNGHLEKLECLAKLKQQNLLTNEEYESQKRKVLHNVEIQEENTPAMQLSYKSKDDNDSNATSEKLSPQRKKFYLNKILNMCCTCCFAFREYFFYHSYRLPVKKDRLPEEFCSQIGKFIILRSDNLLAPLSFFACFMLRFYSLLVAALCFGFMPLYSQVRYNASRGLDPTKTITQYIHESWNTSNGLPQNNGHALCQTRDGYIWIGTQEGLVRFDGMRFTVFNNKNSPLPDNWINAITEDRSGTLWIGSANGYLLSLHNGLFTLYSKEQGYTAATSIQQIAQDRAGCMWIATNDGLYCFEQGVFTVLTTNDRLLSNNVRALCQDEQGTLWIGTEKGLQCRFGTPKGGVWTVQYTTAQGLCDNNIYALTQNASGSVWIGTRNGLSRLANGTFTTFTTAQGLSNNFVRSLLFDVQGTLWIATSGGICRYVNSDFSSYKRSDGLETDETFSLLTDREGELWIGTRGGGIHRFREGTFTTITAANGLAGNNVRSVRQDVQGRMWVGSAGGLSRIEQSPHGDIVPFSFRDDSLAGVNLSSLFFDSKEQIWSGTNSKGLLRFTRQGTSLTMKAIQDTLLYGTLRGIESFQNSKMLIATGKGVVLIDSNGKSLRRFGKQDGLTDKGIVTILQSRSGKVWIGSGTRSEGLFTLYNDTFSTFRGKDKKDSTFLPKRIQILYEDNDTTLWVGSYGGIYRVLPNGNIHYFSIKDGLYDNVAFSIVEDEYGYLWVSCNTGIYRVKKADLNAYANAPPEKRQRLSYTVYGTADGMKSSECNAGEPAGYKSTDGRLWFATIKGVAVVDPRRMVYNPVAPNVIIEELRVDGALSTTATFPSQTEKLEFQYTATCLTAAERVKFKYILEGYDKDWVEAGNRRTAYYTNLPRGRSYRFRVIACNNDGVWNETGALTEFRITPFWWETLWFYGLCVMFVGGTSYQGFRWRTSRLRAKARELERIVAERTKEVQEQAAEIQLANTQLQEKNVEITVSRERLEVMSEVGRSLTSTLTVETIITRLYERVSELMTVDMFGIGLALYDRNCIEYKLVIRQGERLPPYTRSLEDKQQFPVWCIEHNQTVFINDLDSEGAAYFPDYRESVNLPFSINDRTGEKIQSLIYVPLVFENEVIGILSAISFRKNAYLPVHPEMLKMLANYAAIAIANAESLDNLRRTQDQLAKAEKMASLGTLVAGVAHELNTPIGVAVTAASTLHSRTQDFAKRYTEGGMKKSELEAYVQTAQTGADLTLRNLERAANLIQSFKQVSVDQTYDNIRRFGVKQYLYEIITSLQPKWKTTGHRVEIECEEALEMETYAGAIAQIITNFVTNSLLHGFEGYKEEGVMKIEVEREGSNIIMKYSDNGRGIPPEVLPRIFDPFFTTKQANGGTGLGMHIVYNLATQKLQGTVQVKSTLGHGVECTLTVPIVVR